MLWRWIAALGMVSSVLVSGAQGGLASTGSDSKQGEISARGGDTTMKVQVNLVQVRVVVRDSHGKVVAGLNQGDFQLLDSGKKQTISTFIQETAGNIGSAE